jgi:hypothetical protein
MSTLCPHAVSKPSALPFVSALKIKSCLIALVLICHTATAQTSFSVERYFEKQTPIPASILSELDKELGIEIMCGEERPPSKALEATSIQIGSKSPTILVKPSQDGWCLCGVAYCPVWIFEISENKTKRLWSTEATSGVKILNEMTGGLRNIRTSGGTARYEFEDTWVWDGEKYKLGSHKETDHSR